jgi:hypothetical protein
MIVHNGSASSISRVELDAPPKVTTTRLSTGSSSGRSVLSACASSVRQEQVDQVCTDNEGAAHDVLQRHTDLALEWGELSRDRGRAVGQWSERSARGRIRRREGVP